MIRVKHWFDTYGIMKEDMKEYVRMDIIVPICISKSYTHHKCEAIQGYGVHN